jgi:hypothetical protein
MKMINQVMAALRASLTVSGMTSIAVCIGTIAVVNRVPQLRQIVKGE